MEVGSKLASYQQFYSPKVTTCIDVVFGLIYLVLENGHLMNLSKFSIAIFVLFNPNSTKLPELRDLPRGGGISPPILFQKVVV